MKKCIIFGNSYYSEMLCEYLEEFVGMRVVAYTVHGEYMESTLFAGKRNIAFEEVKKEYIPEEHTILVALGYKNMNDLRKQVCKEVLEKGYSLQSFVHPDAKIYTKHVGQGNIFLENVSIGMHVQIGDGNIFWNGCNISHHSEIGDYNFFAPSAATGGKVTIRNNCFVGINATIKSGVTMNNYTLVGAGGYLSKSSEEYDVYVPGQRDRLQHKKSTEMII